MTEAVVDLLEVVQVEKEDGNLALPALGRGERMGEQVVEQGAVGKP